MAVQPIANAAVIVTPDFTRFGTAVKGFAGKLTSSGVSAGAATGDGFVKGAAAKLKGAQGQFSATGKKSGEASAAAFGGSFESKLKGFSGRAGGIMSSLTSAVTGVGLAGLVTFGLKSAASLEQAQVGFETLLGSGKKAQGFLTNLQKFAASTPFELPGLIESSRTLLGVGVSANQVIPMLTAFGDTAGAVGVGQENFQRIIGATSQAISAGKFQAGDLNQIMNNGIPIWTILSKAMHKPVPELRNLASHGKLLSKDVLPVLQKQMEKDYGGAMAKQSQTLAGVWSTLKDSVAIGLANAIKPLVPILENFVPKAANAASAALAGITKVITGVIGAFQTGKTNAGGFLGGMEKFAIAIKNSLPTVRNYVTAIGTGLVNAYRVVAPVIASVVGWFVRHKSVAEALAFTVGALLVVTKAHAAVMKVEAAGGLVQYIAKLNIVQAVTKVWAAVQWILNAALDANPIGLVVIALAALAAGLVYAWTHSAKFRDIVIGAWHGIQAAVSAVVGWFTGTLWPAISGVWSAVSGGAVGVWRALVAAWNGVRSAVASVVGWFTGTLWPALQRVWAGVAAGARWLFHQFDPLWHAIGRIVQAASAVIQLAIAIVVAYIKNVLIPIYVYLWHHVVEPVWHGIQSAVSTSVNVVRGILSGLVAFFRGPVAGVFTWLWHHVAEPVFNGVRTVITREIGIIRAVFVGIKNFITGTLAPIFPWFWHNIIVPVWNGIKTAITNVINPVKHLLDTLGTAVKTTLVNAFHTGVSAIGKAWNALEALAKVPVTFVVKSVINPLIGGFNKFAKIFHTPTIDPIPGFAEGGRIPGAPSSRDNKIAWLTNGAGKAISTLKVATGEFIVNAKDTARALPLLQWINAGMRGGPAEAAKRIGRRPVDMQGDGSEGFAFASGGLVGFLSNVWSAISNPKKAIKEPLEHALSAIPGGGVIKDVVVGMGHKLIDGFFNWATTWGGASSTGGGGNVVAAQNFVRAQAGKPYIWASAGPEGYDCSGIVSAAYNVLKGRNPYSHTFSTESLPGSWFDTSRKMGPLVAGWSHPGQAPASASVGHMAGMIGGMPFESVGSRGVRIGFNARRVTDFANVGAARANGGIVDLAKIARADFGSVTLAQGHNLIYNGTGGPEPLTSPSNGGGRLHPDDIAELAAAIGAVVGGALTSTVPLARVAARQAGRRPR